MPTLKRAMPARAHHVGRERGALSSDALDEFEERAAIAQYDGGLSREHAEILAAICAAPPPAGATVEQVASVIDAAARFLERRQGAGVGR